MKNLNQYLFLLAASCLITEHGFSQNPDSGNQTSGKIDVNAAAEQKPSDKPSEIKDVEWDNPKRIAKHRLKIKKIEAVREEGKKFLKLTIDIPDQEKDFVPYPLIRVVSAGKVIAERGLDTFSLVYVELIPTDLESLPQNFACTVTIKVHGAPDSPIYVLQYPAAD
jgi:hypothetical protein